MQYTLKNSNKPRNQYITERKNRNTIGSPQCSAVLQKNITNESNEMSWLEKLVALQNSPKNQKQLYMKSCNNKIKFTQNQEILTQRSNIEKNNKYYQFQINQQTLKETKLMLNGVEKRKEQIQKENYQQKIENHQRRLVIANKKQLRMGLNESVGKICKNKKSKEKQIIQAIQGKYERQRKKIYQKGRINNQNISINNQKKSIYKINNKIDKSQKPSYKSGACKNKITNTLSVFSSKRNSCHDEMRRIQNINLRLDSALGTDVHKQKNDSDQSNQITREQAIRNNNMLTFNNIKIENEKSNNMNIRINNFNVNLKDELSNIFDLLDVKKQGYLQEKNCNVKNISEDLKIILGPIISQIKFKKKLINRTKFVTESLKIMQNFKNIEFQYPLKETSKISFEQSNSFKKNNQNDDSEQELLLKYTKKSSKTNWDLKDNLNWPIINKDVYMNEQSLIMSRILNTNTDKISTIQINDLTSINNKKNLVNAYIYGQNYNQADQKKDKSVKNENRGSSYYRNTRNYESSIKINKDDNKKKLNFTELTKHI